VIKFVPDALKEQNATQHRRSVKQIRLQVTLNARIMSTKHNEAGGMFYTRGPLKQRPH